MSSLHASIRPSAGAFIVEDLGSTNGTFVDGERLAGPTLAGAGSVVRAGRAVLVIEPDLEILAADEQPPPEMAGRFHTPALVHALGVAARTGKHLILAGESGTGKELCAQRLAADLGRSGPVVAHNCARFASADEAETTLFGVGRGVFSGVDARKGLLEEADDGVLFLDELHALPLRVQRSLLRFVEDGMHARIGASGPRRLSVRLVLATNHPLDAPELAPDLVARLFKIEVPALSRRRADIPDILLAALGSAARAAGIDGQALTGALGPDHFEALCLADLSGRNVRALEAIAAEMVARATRAPDSPDRIVRRVFGDHLAGSVVRERGEADKSGSLYEANRSRIVEAYRSTGQNLSETERVLRAAGLPVNRRWLTIYLRRWGARA